VGAESITELSPRHLVVHRASDGVVGPPRAGVTTQQLRGEDGLLHFGVAQEPELGLHHPKPVISLDRLSYLGEERRMSGRKVTVGGQSGRGSIPGPITTTSRVGHELMQQLGLLIPGLEDRGDFGGGGRFPFPWVLSAPALPLQVFTILSSKHVTISLEIKLSNMTNLSNGKCDNSTITENNGNFCPGCTVNTIF
jgi:hypothetical protein